MNRMTSQDDRVSQLWLREESKWFDVKRAEVKPRDLACLFSAFANTDGGDILIGVDDKTRSLRGINGIGHDALNNLLETPKKCCRPMPNYKEEFIDIVNEKGEQDRLLLFHVERSENQLIRTQDDATYLRVGDRTTEVKGDDLRNLEYLKGTRYFEDEPCINATLEDLNDEAIIEFKRLLDAENIDTKQVLRSRGLMIKKNNEWVLTYAAVLLFANDVGAFYPNCRVRFVRFSGDRQKVGEAYNVEKDISFDTCLLKLLPQVREFIKTQLRDFTALNREDGTFISVPEYPEFAWLEGLVNAITHREYSMQGDFIKVEMFDDRLQITSPGGLPGPVSLTNMREMRYSRNPRIARVLTEYGWVRELNEGVKRIYEEMKKFYLDEPKYSDVQGKVALVLYNNANIRRGRRQDKVKEFLNVDQWHQLDEVERSILTFLATRRRALVRDIVAYVGKSKPTVTARLKRLVAKKILVLRASSPRDPHQTYELAGNV